MTDLREWQMAFLEQARSDWNAYQKTQEPAWPSCHQLHFLQMATEKLSKALLISGEMNLERITHSHAAFAKFMRVVSHNHNLQAELGMNKSQLKALFVRLLPIAHEIEALAPALAQDGPNPEYPWLDKLGHVCIPTKHSFPLAKLLQSPQGTRLLKYIRYFLVEFEKLFLS